MRAPAPAREHQQPLSSTRDLDPAQGTALLVDRVISSLQGAAKAGLKPTAAHRLFGKPVLQGGSRDKTCSQETAEKCSFSRQHKGPDTSAAASQPPPASELTMSTIKATGRAIASPRVAGVQCSKCCTGLGFVFPKHNLLPRIASELVSLAEARWAFVYSPPPPSNQFL